MSTESNIQLTLGSLFDGSGGFPLGGLLTGQITPLWSSEIEPFAIRVTTKRLPQVKHYGDVSAMNGPDFKQTRKILMENLSGHAAFRTDEEAQKFLAREKAKRDALKAAKQAAQNGDPATGETVAPDAAEPTQPDCGADTAQMLEAGA